jgi:hypothetical protein
VRAAARGVRGRGQGGGVRASRRRADWCAGVWHEREGAACGAGTGGDGIVHI